MLRTFTNSIKASAFAVATLLTISSHAEEGTWKTAYVKRGDVGVADAAWVGGTGATQRMRTPLEYGGTKVRVFVQGSHKDVIDLTKMALVKGADDQGRITGSSYPILFKGVPNLTLAASFATAKSDETAIPVTSGTWYLQEQYASQKFPYYYETDSGYSEPGDAFDKESLGKAVKMRTGIVRRVDVFTTDPRTTILCYGDSITQGYGSTPNTGRKYPDILGELLGRPVLNLGQNGDVMAQAARVPGAAKGLPGVDTVVFMMGINDIVSGSRIKTVKDYRTTLKEIIGGCHNAGLKIYIGTIPPAGGHATVDKNPAMEALRQEFNACIAKGNGADGVIDFAAALADPANPGRMQADCQSDWVHPNDLGYRKMAEAAAKVLMGKQTAATN